MRQEILRMKDICKSESSIRVVRDASFHVFQGEVVGLVGKTYAGKSTLMGAVTGEAPCDTGRIWIEEKQREIDSIETARKNGVFLIKDVTSLINEFTIEDTMHLNFAFAGKKERYGNYVKKCRDTLKLLNVEDAYDTSIRKLNFHKRVLLEIAQALVCEAKLIVLDMVMGMLSSTARTEFEELFRILKRKGVSFVLIESEASVIQRYLDRLCIMRKGRVAAELLPEEMAEDLILAVSEGGNYEHLNEWRIEKREPYDDKKVLEFRQVHTANQVIRNLSFSLFTNEVLGIWNKNRHSGQAIIELLEKKLAMADGKILVNGNTCEAEACDWIQECGVFTVPEEDELFSNMNVEDNISFAALKRTAKLGCLARKGELRYLVQSLCEEYMAEGDFQLFPGQPVPDGILARKKISLCRAIAGGAKIIVYNNPFLKMDIREREAFARDIIRTQKRHISQIIISSQAEVLYSLCERVIQVDEGKNVKEITQ